MSTAPENSTSGLLRQRGREWREIGLRNGLFLCALISVLTTAAIIGVLGFESSAFFAEVSITEFLFGTRWTPLLEPRSFGVLPLVCGTLLIVGGAGLIALPLGLGSAIYLSEFASRKMRNLLKPVLEILAGIPTVVYGYFALTFITPILQTLFPSTEIYNAAAGAIVVGIMVLPMVTSLCDDSLRAVPDSMRQAGYALGATQFEVTSRVLVPASLSGVLASFVLALSRAVGETMAVTLAAGSTPNLTINPLEQIQTMTSFIVSISKGDAQHGTVEYQSLFAVGALLFVMTLAMNVVSNRIMRRFKETYE